MDTIHITATGKVFGRMSAIDTEVRLTAEKDFPMRFFPTSAAERERVSINLLKQKANMLGIYSVTRVELIKSEYANLPLAFSESLARTGEEPRKSRGTSA